MWENQWLSKVFGVIKVVSPHNWCASTHVCNHIINVFFHDIVSCHSQKFGPMHMLHSDITDFNIYPRISINIIIWPYNHAACFSIVSNSELCAEVRSNPGRTERAVPANEIRNPDWKRLWMLCWTQPSPRSQPYMEAWRWVHNRQEEKDPESPFSKVGEWQRVLNESVLYGRPWKRWQQWTQKNQWNGTKTWVTRADSQRRRSLP